MFELCAIAFFLRILKKINLKLILLFEQRFAKDMQLVEYFRKYLPI